MHAGLRWRAARARSHGDVTERPPVYLYSTYERTWHWLQALAITLLILTGIEIHVTREACWYSCAWSCMAPVRM